MADANREIWVVPFFGQGHLLPCVELCKHIASRNFRTTLVISSDLASTIPSSLHQHPLLRIAELPSSPPPPPQFHHHQPPHSGMAHDIQLLMDSRPPICAVVDVMMGWTHEVFNNLGVPIISLFTSGACSAAMEYAMWDSQVRDLKPGEIHVLPGLPEEMAVTDADLKTKPHGHAGGRGGPRPPPGMSPRPGRGPPRPPKPGDRPRWLAEAGGSIAYMMNTCGDLEHIFLEYLANQIGKPVWGVGPLLPEQYWKLTDSVFHDSEFRTNRRSSISEDEVVAWLDSKPRASVLYVSFGTEVGLDKDECGQLRDALEASRQPFIWVIQLGSGRPGPPPRPDDGDSEQGYSPDGLESAVGERGLIIRGWAPQLMILSHPSTGAFLSHCGWNSTVEAIGRGVPILAWPIRGDQHYNAKLVVKHLKVGHFVSHDLSSQTTKEEDLVKGIERVLGDDEVKERAVSFTAKFNGGFPVSAMNCLDAFAHFVSQKASGNTHSEGLEEAANSELWGIN